MFEDFDKCLRNIFFGWELALPTSTLLIISGHFKRFQWNDLISQLTKIVNIF